MNPHLTQFAKQLALWTEDIIDHGRTPFRRVDTAPQIETERGIISPPLVFWINRQSMMTGGIVFLPDNNLAEELEQGRVCASALGLRHFVTWETEQVRIWQISAEGVTEYQSFPLDDPDNLESFRDLLADLLDALKLLAVLGAIPPAELSHWYLSNLFQITLQQALPPLVEAYRSQRSEMDEHSPEDADICANEANRLLLLQVLSLLWFDKLPDAILPEKMERAIELSLPELPDKLRRTLSLKTTIKPPALPQEAAVSFHHLLLRLRQLTWQHSPERSKQSIFSLNQSWYRDTESDRISAPIQLYPTVSVSDDTTETVLSNSPSLLAISALLTEITQQIPKKMLFGNLFQIGKDALPNQDIAARLTNRTGIASSKRREFTARLRTAWPNHHLKIKTGQPYWSWELTHLLGICHAEQQITLDLPVEILNELKNLKVWALLHEKCRFSEVEQITQTTLRFSGICSSDRPHHLLTLTRGAVQRKVSPVDDPVQMRNHLLLALNLSNTIYKLLGQELVWPERNHSQQSSLGREIYYQSALFHWFQAILSDTLDAIPEPEPLLLKELDKVANTDKQIEDLDLFLARLLGCPAVAEIIPPEHSIAVKPTATDVTANKKLKATLHLQLETHGIPNFPEQYLYFLENPEINHYSITPPLDVKNSFLGQFEIQDAQGQLITGYGTELEQALLLCAESGKNEFDLPKDRHQLEQLLDHYKKDLQSLYKYLATLCYSQIENSKTAKQTIKATWRKLSLPNPAWFKE
jgi:hypothetical protein